MDRNGYVDIHTHWLVFGRDSVAIQTDLEWLEARGFEKIVVFPMPRMGTPLEKIMDLIPAYFHEMFSYDPENTEYDDLRSWWEFQRGWLMKPHTLELISFLDIRAWNGKESLAPCWGEGHGGLKGVLIEEEDCKKMVMNPLRKSIGLSRKDYVDTQRKIFAAAEQYNVPLIYHADLNLHYEFIMECLQAYPGVRVNIPHCGMSRRKMSVLLDRFPSLFTDIANLGPYIIKDQSSYVKFISENANQVMLGSDAMASVDLKLSWKYIEYVSALGLPDAIEQAVVCGTAQRFLYGGTA